MAVFVSSHFEGVVGLFSDLNLSGKSMLIGIFQTDSLSDAKEHIKRSFIQIVGFRKMYSH